MIKVENLPAPPQILLDGASLFLDFDGTLVALAERPEAVIVSNSLRHMLSALNKKLQGRLAIVSGRDVATLRQDFGLTDIIIAGSHGAELSRPAEETEAAVRAEGLSRAMRELEKFAASRAGILIEDKPLGIGLHYRQAPQWERDCFIMAEMLAKKFDLLKQHGKMMIELRGENAHKGLAIKKIMQYPDFAKGCPLFIGDDITDEDGFIAAQELGGSGVKVGINGKSGAKYALPNVDAVHAFLT